MKGLYNDGEVGVSFTCTGLVQYIADVFVAMPPVRVPFRLAPSLMGQFQKPPERTSTPDAGGADGAVVWDDDAV